MEVFGVTGGGDQAWAAVKTQCVPSNEKGKRGTCRFDFCLSFQILKSLINKEICTENVYFVRFDLEGKIAEAKILMDTRHTHTHLRKEW